MPFSWFDITAIAIFVLCWAGYTMLLGDKLKRPIVSHGVYTSTEFIGCTS